MNDANRTNSEQVCPDCGGLLTNNFRKALKGKPLDGTYWQNLCVPCGVSWLRTELADSQANALSEAQAGENSADEVIRLRKALMEIRRYPKGWKNRGSIQDFIDEMVPLDARPQPAVQRGTHDEINRLHAEVEGLHAEIREMREGVSALLDRIRTDRVKGDPTHFPTVEATLNTILKMGAP